MREGLGEFLPRLEQKFMESTDILAEAPVDKEGAVFRPRGTCILFENRAVCFAVLTSANWARALGLGSRRSQIF